MRILSKQQEEIAASVFPDTPVREWDPNFEFTFSTPREVRIKQPYKLGDVIWVENCKCQPVKAIIMTVGSSRTPDGDWRAFYNVLIPTILGNWSALWFRRWPGQIERAYVKVRASDAK